MAHILISEPTEAIRQLMAHVAQQLGHTTSVFPDDACDVLVVELAWPAGRELALRLRRQRPELPIVCVSSRWLPAVAGELDTSAYLMKPFRLEGLRRALARAVAEAQSA